MSPKDDVDDAPHPTAEEADLAEPVLVPPRGLWAVALALFVLSAAAAILWAPPLRPRLKPSLVLDTWRNADIAGMRAADDALLKRVPTAPEQVALEKTILAQFGQFLQREATLSGQTADDPAARLALGAAEESVRALVQRHGRDALSRMAVQFGRDVRVAVDKSLIASRAAQQPFAQRLVAQPLPEDVSALAALAGALGPTLERTGIERQFHDGHLDPAAGQVIETIAQMRFLLLGARVQAGRHSCHRPRSFWCSISAWRRTPVWSCRAGSRCWTNSQRPIRRIRATTRAASFWLAKKNTPKRCRGSCAPARTVRLPGKRETMPAGVRNARKKPRLRRHSQRQRLDRILKDVAAVGVAFEHVKTGTRRAQEHDAGG